MNFNRAVLIQAARRSNQEWLPRIEALRKRGHHVAVWLDGEGFVVDVRAVLPPPACFVPEPGVLVHGPIPCGDEIVEVIEIDDHEAAMIAASVNNGGTLQ